MAFEEAETEQEPEFENSFGGRLRRVRYWYGVSQRTLAQVSGISRYILSEYEQDLRDPLPEDEILLARVLHLKTQYLVYGEKPPTEEEIAAQRLQFRLERVSRPEAQTALQLIDGIQHSLLVQARRRGGKL